LFLTFTIVGSAGNEPVLKMTTTLYNSAGAMFWSETYSGGAIKITILGTYSDWGIGMPSDGAECWQWACRLGRHRHAGGQTRQVVLGIKIIGYTP
jgi:hypothetical protein